MSVVVRLFPGSASRARPPSLYPALRMFPTYALGRWIYAVGFANGITKIGSTSSPRGRVRTHVLTADGAVDWVHLFGHWAYGKEHYCRQAEADACRRAVGLSTERHAKEWFAGLSRDDALRCVREASAVQRERAQADAELLAAKKRKRRRA